MLSKDEETAWRTLRANGYKSNIGMCGVLNGILFIVTLILALLFAIPLFPPSLFDYGWIYHVPHAVLWAPALAISGSKSVELLSIVALILVLPTLMLDVWVFAFNMAPWLYGCIVNSPSSFYYECVVSAPYMITLFVLAALFFFSTVLIFYNIFSLLTYIKNSLGSNAYRRQDMVPDYTDTKRT
jgi:hypothetical protein